MPDYALLIIGYGNPLRGDDGLGWQAAERLAALGRPGWHVLTCQQLTPDLAEPLSRAQRAVFIDAAAAGEPGQITRRALAPAEPQPAAFSHQLEPAGLLALARAWYGAAPPADLITVAGASFDYAETLSPSVAAALEDILRLMTTS